MIKYKRKLNIIAGEPPEPIRLGQYDDDVVIEFDLYTSEGILTIDPDTAVAIRGIKPDGNGVSVEGVLKCTEDKYTEEKTYTACIDVTKQMTACAGECRYKLVLTKDGKELNTGSFIVNVDGAALDKDMIPSGSEIREIVETLDRTDDLLKASRSITKAKKDIEEAVRNTESARREAVEAAKSVQEIRLEIAAVKEEIAKQGEDVVGNLDTIQQTAEERINSRLSQVEKEKNSTADTLRKMMDTVDVLQRSIDDLTQAHKDMKVRVEHMEFEMFKTGGKGA